MTGSIYIPNFCDSEETRGFKSYVDYLAGFVLSMFEWRMNFAPSYAPEWWLASRGHCGIFFNGGKPVIACGGYTGSPTAYGFGDKYIGSDFSGSTYAGEVGKDVVVLWNNRTLSPDTPIISSYARRFVESDKSVLNVLRGTRITNLVTAADNTDKTTLDGVVKAIKDGDTVVKIPPSYREIDALDNGSKRFDVIRLTDPKDTDKLQYLSRYRDDILASFLQEYGLDVDVINKGSQVTKDEIHSMSAAVSAVISQRLECRERDLDIVRGWGFEIEVKPGNMRRVIDESEVDSSDSSYDN